MRATAHGEVHVLERVYAADHHHGHAPVSRVLDAEPAHLAALALDPTLAEVDPSRMLLLDTETTGLAGGTGTLPFVVGLGWFEGRALRVEQLVLRRPGQERPILSFIAEHLERATLLVTYNGKTFDWPLLRNRFVMNRLTAPAPKPHLDLLHCARRIYRHRDAGAKLVHLEEKVLGHRRVGDVPGDQIPELYFRFLRTGNGGLIAPVLEHNAQDMILLAALLGVLVRQFAGSHETKDARDQLGYAQVAARAGDRQRALQFARAAAAGAGSRGLSTEALALAAALARRTGDVASAVESLSRAVKLASGERLSALHLELSKLYEHDLKDFARALEHARHSLAAEGPEAHRRRLDRLARRMRVRTSPTLPLQL